MSLRRPPSRPAAPGAGSGRPQEPDYDSLDVAPDETVDGVTLDDLDTVEAEDVRGPRGSNGRGGNGPSTARGGRGAAVADPDAGEADDAYEYDPDSDDPEELESTPVVERAVPVSTVAMAPTAVATLATADGELTLGEWLQRRWLYGLTYWQGALLFFLFVALIITRFFNLGDRAMHHDESMHAKFAWDTFHGTPIYKYNPLLHGPFQFLAVAASFWIFGATEWTARAVPAIFGVALVCLTFLWRRWLGTAGWLFAIAILVFSPSFTYFARMLREDSYTATWTLLAATGLIGYVLHRKRAWFYAFCAGLSFAFATKESTYITAFIWGTFMILSVLWERSDTWFRRIIAGAAAGGLVGAFLVAVIGVGKAALGGKLVADVTGGLIGILIGAAAGFVYNQLTPVETRVLAVSGPGARARRPRDGRRGAAGTAALAGPVRPLGTFTGAFVSLWRDREGFWGVGTFWGGIIVFFAIFIVLFSSLFTNLPGIREGMIGSIRYWLEQHDVQRGNQPWFYYLILLSVYETLAWVFGIVASVYYLRPGKGTWLTSFLIWWWALALTIYSWAGEKMPWLIIHIATPLVLLSARYLGELAMSATRSALNTLNTRGTTGAPGPLGASVAVAPASAGVLGVVGARSIWERRIAFGGLGLLSLWTLHTGWPVNFERPDTPKDILVYTQSAPDVKKVMADIERISLEQTGNVRDIGVVVQSGTWWPFSWYMRDYKNAEYPANLTTQATKPIVLIALEDDEKNRPFLVGYTKTKYKMRWWYPEDYRNLKPSSFTDLFTKKDVRDGLWKWLIYREPTQPLGSYDFYLYLKEGLGPVSAGAPAAAGASGPPGQAGQARLDPTQLNARQVPLVSVAQWGANGRGQGQLNTPRGVALNTQGNVYVADTLNHRIQKFSRTGQPLAAWGAEGTGDGQFKEPMGVAVDAQGNVYVADTWNHRVQKLDSNGRFVAKWSGQGGFWGPRAVALDGQANVYVVDTGNKRIQKFDTTGRFLAQFGADGTGPGQFREPIGLAVTPDGQMYVADTNNRRIQQLAPDGRFVAEWPLAGWQGGARNEPYLAVDTDGSVIATDPPNARIVKLAPGGEVVAVGGAPGRAAGQFEVPLGIAIGDAIYVADSGNHRIQAVTFGG